MKKFIAIMLVMFGVTFMASAGSPMLELGKAIGEIVVLPIGVVAGACEGIYEGVSYIVTGESSETTTTITKTTYTQTTAPVYVVPSQTKKPENNVVINNSPGASVTINEVNSSTTRTPTVIYVPSTRPNYYYYQPYRYCYP